MKKLERAYYAKIVRSILEKHNISGVTAAAISNDMVDLIGKVKHRAFMDGTDAMLDEAENLFSGFGVDGGDASLHPQTTQSSTQTK